MGGTWGATIRPEWASIALPSDSALMQIATSYGYEE